MILPWDFANPRSFENIYIQNARVLHRWQSEDSLARSYCRKLTGDSPGKVHTLLHTLTSRGHSAGGVRQFVT